MTNTDSATERYIATVNVPGYSPMSNEPAVFATVEEAWGFLADERRNAEDDGDVEEYSDTFTMLRFLAADERFPNKPENVAYMIDVRTMCGTVYGETPEYDGTHDLGFAYSVEVLED